MAEYQMFPAVVLYAGSDNITVIAIQLQAVSSVEYLMHNLV